MTGREAGKDTFPDEWLDAKTYYTHNNGERPYMVVVTSDSVHVYDNLTGSMLSLMVVGSQYRRKSSLQSTIRSLDTSVLLTWYLHVLSLINIKSCIGMSKNEHIHY